MKLSREDAKVPLGKKTHPRPGAHEDVERSTNEASSGRQLVSLALSTP